MGMSASQARLIALTARMSDVEYEGQQINQQRLTLSNKISDIYSQMEAMTVPTPPSPQDFMVPSYKGKDASGNNITVQANNDGSFDYYKDVTGKIAKEAGQLDVTKGENVRGKEVKLSDITDSVVGKFTQCSEDQADYFVTETIVADPSKLFVKTGETSTTSKETADLYGTLAKGTAFKHKVNVQHAASDLKPGSQTETWGSAGTHEEERSCGANDTGAYAVEWNIPTFAAPTSLNAETEYFSDQYGQNYFGKGSTFVDINSVEICKGSIKDGVELGGSAKHGDKALVATKTKPAGACTAVNDKKDISDSELAGLYIVKDGNPPKIEAATSDDVRNADASTKFMRKDSNGTATYFDPNSSNGTATVGNRTTYNSIEAARSAGVASEALEDAISGLKHSFPSDGQGYDWDKDFGVLVSSDGAIQFFVKPQATDDNPNRELKNGMSVDIYNPSTGTYKEKVGDSKTNGAPTFDGTGQPKSINIGGQAVELSVEKELDEIAYQSAQADYTRAKNVYDAEQDALNRKTSTYQMEDKKLDLKLKRLDTERNALNTEIDAVKKVIQDATDKGFKTFSG